MIEVRCAVVGSPIAHSRSPILHRAAYAALGLTGWTYDRVELQATQLAGWLSGLDKTWRGVSVTMPVKQSALDCADSASELASLVGAANTLLRTERGWHADNTDVAGLLGALDEGRTAAGRAASATVLGAGGTASAAVAALAALGHKDVGIVVREPARAQALFGLLARLSMTGQLYRWPGLGPPERTFSGEGRLWDVADRTFSGESSPADALCADLVISTVPAAATTDLLSHRWRAGQTVLDVSYDPWPPALVQAAAAGGAQAIGGAAVLLWQAVRQVELITGRPPPVEAMRAALLPGGSLAPA
ncbi:MAG: shikimate dehydrogenase [Actinomycetota bacterium]|nr:shikimate dehydrogenase [Actinomycetota bacterium]